MPKTSLLNAVELTEKLNKALIENNIDISSEHIQKIERYIIELFKWNSVYNLTGIKGLDNNISKNIIDCLVIAPFLEGTCFLDIGTGGGLPGIPLAIYFQNVDFLLVD